jgi:hypothetical protein
MAATGSSCDIELIAQDGTVVPLMFARPLGDDGITVGEAPLTIEEALSASDAETPLSEWLEAQVIEDWFPGIGMAYDAAPGADTFTSPGYVFPGGAATTVTLPAPNNSGSPIIAILDHGPDVWVAQAGDGAANTARVMRSVGGTAAFTDSLNLGAGEYMRDLLVARDASTGITYLWASSSSNTAAAGRMHRWDGAIWVSTAVNLFGAGVGRNRMVKVFWEGEDGVGDWRIVALSSGRGHLSYTRPGSDPMLAPSWVEMVPVGGGEGVGDLTAAKRHVWGVSALNVYDFDELGNSPALTAYTVPHRGNGLASFYHEGFVYRSLGIGVDRVRVDQGPIIQGVPGICSPGFGTKAESEYLTGYAVAFSTYLGGILMATYAPIVGRSLIYWGIDRTTVGTIETPNPLIWHGPFAVSDLALVATRMHVTAAGDDAQITKLWVAAWPTSQVDQPTLAWISLPSPGGALQDLRVSGGHTFANGAGTGSWQDFSQLHMLPTTVGDKGSDKEIYQITVGSLGLGSPTAATKLDVYTRADPTPSTTTWGTPVAVTSGPTADITPVITSGNKLQTRVDFFSPSGAASPPKPAILDSIRTTYWRTAPDVNTWTFSVEYGPGVPDLQNSDWRNQGRDVNWYTDQLIAMCRSGRITMRDRQNRRWSVKLKQALPRRSSTVEAEYGRITRARITVALLGDAA